MMTLRRLINQAREGRPDLTAVNAGSKRLRVAAFAARYPDTFGGYYTARELVYMARRAQRCADKGLGLNGLPE